MQYALYFIIGAVFNRIRGGLINLYWPAFKGIGKHVNDAAFGLFCGAVLYGLDITAWSSTTWNDVAWYTTAMWAGRSLGWGEYIGAMIDKKIHSGDEVDFIDAAIKKYTDRPVLWGFLGLTLRGGLWGMFIALVAHSIIPALAGSLMGCVYFCTIKIADLQDGKADTVGANKGWGYGEYVFGGILWMSCAYALS